ncbi:MAG: hypothetical protein LBV19_05805 [Streptococcaceae bacterium]|nr:hypothetical protein [Streptococcaceae bacterium]
MATKEDWLEYFEMMNDRKPTFQEYQNAMKKGEIEADAAEERVTPQSYVNPEVTARDSISAVVSKNNVDSESDIAASLENSEESEGLKSSEEAQEISEEGDGVSEVGLENCSHENFTTDEIMALSGKRYILQICKDCGKIELTQ